jgi:hypothetical protein
MGAVGRDRTARRGRRRRRRRRQQQEQQQQQLAQSRWMVQAARCRRTRARAHSPTRQALQETSLPTMLGNAVVLLAQQRDRSCATSRRQRRIGTADFPHGAIVRIYFKANAPTHRNRFTWFLQQHKYAALR